MKQSNLLVVLGWVGLGQSADGLGWIRSHKMEPWTTLLLTTLGNASFSFRAKYSAAAAAARQKCDLWCGTMTVGMGALRMTYSQTLPLAEKRRPPVPREPHTIRSAPSSSAMRQMPSPMFFIASQRTLCFSCVRDSHTDRR